MGDPGVSLLDLEVTRKAVSRVCRQGAQLVTMLSRVFRDR